MNSLNNIPSSNYETKSLSDKMELENIVWDIFQKTNKKENIQFLENLEPSEILTLDEGIHRFELKLNNEQIITILRHRRGTPRAPTNDVQVLLRVGVVSFGKRPQVNFQNNQAKFTIKFNGKIIKPKPKEPINLMPFYNLIPKEKNTLIINFYKNKYYVMKFFLGKLSSTSYIESKSPPSPLRLLKLRLGCGADYEPEFDSNEEVVITSQNLPITCPISKKTVDCPCRSEQCLHLRCFDLASFLKVFLTKRKWFCPVCSKLIKNKAICIDRFMSELIKQLPEGCTSIKIARDGTIVVPIYNICD